MPGREQNDGHSSQTHLRIFYDKILHNELVVVSSWLEYCSMGHLPIVSFKNIKRLYNVSKLQISFEILLRNTQSVLQQQFYQLLRGQLLFKSRSCIECPYHTARMSPAWPCEV